MNTFNVTTPRGRFPLGWLSRRELAFPGKVGFHQRRTQRPTRRVFQMPPRCSDTSNVLSVIRKIGNRIRSGDTTAQDVTKSYIDKLRVSDEVVGSFISVTADLALEQAKAVDDAFAAGIDPGPLAGIPFAIKDNICLSVAPTTAGSRLLQGHQAPYDAQTINALKASGAIIFGKTNLDEFGMGSTTESSAFRATRNPWDVSRVPGGSSGGSAAAVAAQQCAAAIGSDTGGSIRQPASFCGVVGLKPTYGLLPRHGLVAYASSFDCIGPLTSSVEDAAMILSVLCCHHISDDATLQNQSLTHNFHSALRNIKDMNCKPFAGRRFAMIKETLGSGVDKQVAESIIEGAKQMEELGAVVDVVSCPSFHLGLPAYYILALSEASSNLARYDSIRFGSKVTRSEGLGSEVKRRMLMGSYALSAGHSDAYYKRAQEVTSSKSLSCFSNSKVACKIFLCKKKTVCSGSKNCRV
mmetsp:Transcript_30156/g.74834  ORF Transcript_30156/g.74834 Transcript_30156/m.74834 type:complete len:466 (-) Transcript_30156:1190-2587(-)